MQPIWIGDRRDRVKWGALVHLARREKIKKVLAIPFLRDEAGRELRSTAAAEPFPLPVEVWSHFSDLDHSSRLAKATDLEILQFDAQAWTHPRENYLHAARDWLMSQSGPRKILFLDPDTGLEPASRVGLQHVTRSEVHKLWSSLQRRDWLVLYQHATRTGDWRERRFNAFCACCPQGHAELLDAPLIAKDVVIYAARR